MQAPQKARRGLGVRGAQGAQGVQEAREVRGVREVLLVREVQELQEVERVGVDRLEVSEGEALLAQWEPAREPGEPNLLDGLLQGKEDQPKEDLRKCFPAEERRQSRQRSVL